MVHSTAPSLPYFTCDPQSGLKHVGVHPHADTQRSDHRQMQICRTITFHIRGQFRFPPFMIACRPRSAVWTSMPEATVHSHCDPCAHEHHVSATSWHARQWPLQPIPQTRLSQCPPQHDLRHCVTAALPSPARSRRLIRRQTAVATHTGSMPAPPERRGRPDCPPRSYQKLGCLYYSKCLRVPHRAASAPLVRDPAGRLMFC